MMSVRAITPARPTRARRHPSLDGAVVLAMVSVGGGVTAGGVPLMPSTCVEGVGVPPPLCPPGEQSGHSVGVAVGVSFGVSVGSVVPVGVAVGVSVGVAVGVSVGVAVGVSVG